MNQDDDNLLRQIIEASGEMWLAARDRSFGTGVGVIICANPERAFYLERSENHSGQPQVFMDGWIVEEERPLKMTDAAEFFAAFGDHWHYWIGAIIKDAPLRAYIKNGRKEGWTISLDIKTEALSESLESLTHSLAKFHQNLKVAERVE